MNCAKLKKKASNWNSNYRFCYYQKILMTNVTPSSKSVPEPAAPAGADAAHYQGPKSVVHLIADAMDMIADEDGYAFMGELGNLLIRQQPDFDPRNYGFSKLTQLIKSIDRFEVDVRQTSNPHTKHIYLRDKKRK